MGKQEQGVFRERYTLIPRTLIFITRGEHILLLKGAPTKRLWAGLYNGVGGHVEFGEGILKAAQRELLEETGLSVPNLRLCGVVHVNTGQFIGIGLYVFHGEYTGGDLRPSQEGDLEWVHYKDLHHLPLVEDLYQLIPRVLQSVRDQQPFVAYYFYDEEDRLQVEFEGR